MASLMKIIRSRAMASRQCFFNVKPPPLILSCFLKLEYIVSESSGVGSFHLCGCGDVAFWAPPAFLAWLADGFFKMPPCWNNCLLKLA
eukprot:CAMPEP_0180711768 /NCGR_PEP_ID=MMETSP1038_2-20121128/11026_1 /TAXON_ID=632150 /ORGANISM="Azadinium spinosum, Strain 3D9" /LENGTH=87 /DNA_ID=CAMNT_0022744011 /DNA_START=269 /DNA_END=532 /DNA_ORIENTATION=+